MATTLPSSVYSSRRNSLRRDDQIEPKARSRRPSVKDSSFAHPHDDKIAVQDSFELAATQDADSMKYPVPYPDYTANSNRSFADASFGDFGKSLIDDDYLKGFGLARMPATPAVPDSRTASRGHSRGTSRAPDPFNGSHSTSIYELDVPQTAYPTVSTPERGGRRPAELSAPNWGTPKQSAEMARLRTPDFGSQNASGIRKGSAPVIRGAPTSPSKEGKVKRLSGLSLKSVKSAFSRNDYPEVVQPLSPAGPPSRSQQTPNTPRVPDLNPRGADPHREYVMPSPLDSMVQSYSQTAYRQPRAMASTPQFHQQTPTTPSVPRPWMTRRPSASSLRSTVSNVNKPLPPEPGQQPSESAQRPSVPAVPSVTSSRAPSFSSTRAGSGPPKPWQRSIHAKNYPSLMASVGPPVPRVWQPSTHAKNYPSLMAAVGPPVPQAWQAPAHAKNYPSLMAAVGPPIPQLQQGQMQGQTPTPSRRDAAAPAQPSQLRSKYAPKLTDLDALDDAFQRSTPGQSATNIYGGTFIAAVSPRDQLDPIRESPANSQSQLDLNAPLQISRGPGKMEPMRRPPPTPGSRSRSPVSIARSKPSTPEPPKLPSQTQHVASQSIQTTRRPSVARADSSTLHLGGGPTKVQQLLGEGEGPNESVSGADLSTERKGSIAASSRFDTNERQDSVQSMQSPQAQQAVQGPLSGQISPPPPTGGAQMNRTESLSSHAGAFRTGTSDVQFDEIRRRLELLSPTTITDSSFMSASVFGQMLSTPHNPAEQNRPEQTRTDEGNPEPAASAFIEELPGDTVRVRSMAPVELPTEANWAMSLAGLHEMAESDSPRVSIQPATPAPLRDMMPPPIPESPKRESRRDHSHTQSMLSTGSGRTKSIRSIKSARSARSAKARSITSAAASEIPELYAGLPSPRTTLASRRTSARVEDDEIPELPPMPEVATTEELEEMDVISADTAEQVLYQILRNLLHPRDLFSASLVSRGFQRTFRRHDTKLLRNALWYSSPPAWEYIEMHMPISSETGQLEYPPDVYRVQWISCMSDLTTLKAMILHHCGKSLSPITALMLESKDPKHSSPVDDAIWRIWTFCKIFGEDEDRREDLELQKQWIKGLTIFEARVRGLATSTISAQDVPAFGFGNDEGLSPEELMRIGEIWLCLRVLVRGYRGRRHEAREFGIFEGADVPRGDPLRENALLDEWTIHLLSVAPGTCPGVLCPQTATQENFIMAESLGFTSWTPPGRNFTSSGFLTGPICSVLEEWLADEGRANARASHNSAVHPAFRSQQVFPSRQQVGLFVDRLRTVKDVLVSPRPEQKPDMLKLSDVGAVPEASIESDRRTPAAEEAMPPVPKTPKDKKAGFAGFSSKMSLRLPSRSQTTSKKTKAQASQVTKVPSTEAPTLLEPGPSVENTKEGRFFSRSKSMSRGTRIFSRQPKQKGRGQDAAESTVNSARDLPADAKSRRGSQSVGYDTEKSDQGATDPRAVARTRLIAQGFEAFRVDSVIDECLTANGVDVDKAVKKLKKSRKLEDRLKRLDRMG